MTHPPPVLIPRLVPGPLWGQGMRKDGRINWTKLSKQLRDLAGHRCEICGGSSEGAPTNWQTCLDEVWAYEYENRTAYLIDLKVICWWCNAIIHFGFTHSTQTPATARRALDHASRLNGLPPDDMQKICMLHLHHHEEVSKHTDWTQDWDDWEAVADAARERIQAARSA